jgi:type II secretory pathway pseudopilin PulG
MRNTFTNLRRATKRGLTLIEALLFLGIAAIVIVGAVLFYNNASGSARTNDALTQVNALTTGVKGLYSGTARYGANGADLVPAVINSGVAPRNTVNTTTNTLVNPWGGATLITAGGGGAHFAVVMNGVPQDACVRILTAGLLTQGGMFSAQVRQGVAAAPNAAPAASATVFTVTAPPDPATAAAACTAGANNQLLFYVR